MYKNVKKLRNKMNLTQEEFSKKIGISRANLGNIENERVGLTDRVINDICKAFNVNEEWLRTGVGEMFIPLTPNDEFSMALGELLATENQYVKDLFRKIYKMNEDDRNTIIKSIEIMTRAISSN